LLGILPAEQLAKEAKEAEEEMLVGGDVTINNQLPPEKPSLGKKLLPLALASGLFATGGGLFALPAIIDALTPEKPTVPVVKSSNGTDTWETIRLHPSD